MKNLVFLFLLVMANSCVLIMPSTIKNEFNQCYDGKNPDVNSQISKNGYFMFEEKRDEYFINASGKREHITDTLYTPLLLYRDGMCVTSFFERGYTVEEYFIKVLENKNQGITDRFFNEFWWGHYVVIGDTIKAQFVHKPYSLNDSWAAFENWYKIIDQNTIIEIAIRHMAYDRLNETKSAMDLKILDKNKTFKFFPVDTLPSSNGWIKNESWFWCNGIIAK